MTSDEEAEREAFNRITQGECDFKSIAARKEAEQFNERVRRTTNASNALSDNPYRIEHAERIAALERVAEAARHIGLAYDGNLPFIKAGYALNQELVRLDALKDSDAREGQTAGRAQYNPSIAERRERFQNTTGALGYMTKNGPTGANHHPDRCVCQLDDPTPHKHYDEPPFACARCECKAYRPALDALKDSGSPGNATSAIERKAEDAQPEEPRPGDARFLTRADLARIARKAASDTEECEIAQAMRELASAAEGDDL